MIKALSGLAVIGLASAALTGFGAVASAAPMAGQQAVITINFPSCEGCVIEAYNARSGRASVFLRKVTVKNGKAILTVPAAKTVGMAFSIETPKFHAALGGNAVPVIAMGFAGVPAGSEVSKADTKASGAKANWCWAGVSGGRATIDVSSYRVTVPGNDADSGPQIYAWASPTQSTWHDSANMQPAGSMGQQDAPYCS